MDLETQQEQFDETIKLNSILSSIEKQNTLLDEISKNNQAARPTNSIVLDKPVLSTDNNKNKDSEKDLNFTKQDDNSITSISIKEDVTRGDSTEDAEQTDEDNIVSKEPGILEDKPVADIKIKEKEEEPTNNIPDWLNIVKNQISELVDNNSNKDVVEFSEFSSLEKKENTTEEKNNTVAEPEISNKENVAEIAPYTEINDSAAEKALQDVEPVVRINSVTEKISEKSQDNFYKISDLKEDLESIEPVQETEEQTIEPEKEASVINVISKNKSSSTNSLKENANLEAEPAEINEKEQEIAQINSEETPEPTVAALPEQETLESGENNQDQEFSENIDNLKKENNQPSPAESIPEVTQTENKFIPEETSESSESVNSLETLVSEISKQIVTMTQNNDKNFLNIANIMIGISNSLRAMNNNLSNLGGNNILVNQGDNGAGNKDSFHKDTYNESNLARYRQQIRNSDMINDVATRVLRHSMPGVTL